MFEIATELENIHAGLDRVRDVMELVSDFLCEGGYYQSMHQYESILSLGMFELDDLIERVESIHTVLYARAKEEKAAK